MAASKLILFGTSFIRIQRNSSATTPSSSSSSISNLLHSYPHFNKSSSSCFPRLHLFTNNSYCSATASSVDELPDTVTESNESISVSHPWPEWVGFINKLKSKGYFDDSSFKTEDDNGGGGGGDENFSYNDLNRLKHACLSFARERFDLCKSLSRDDIETVVKYGCPSLTRKAVNSAKKLRAYVRLDEGDVCGGCTLRGSCDRAYVILNDSEAAARTADIVRLLMIYAIDPLVHSGEKPHGRDHIETSARKLLAQLIDLSETTIDPALPKPAVRATSQKTENVDRERPQNIEMKRGDWMCSNCNFMNFARNIQCRECKTDGPKRVSVNDAEMKKGDWNCPQCEFMNFARNKNCLRCQESRPQRELNPGEWECPKCDFLNYKRNTSCLKCNCDRPKDDAADYEEQMWKRPS